MGEIADKAKDNANKDIGAANSAAGKVTGNDKLRVDGEDQKIKGKAQKAKGAVKGAFGNKI